MGHKEHGAYGRVTICDKAKFRTHFLIMLTLWQQGCQSLIFDKKFLPLACKFKICYFCYRSTKSYIYFGPYLKLL